VSDVIFSIEPASIRSVPQGLVGNPAAGVADQAAIVSTLADLNAALTDATLIDTTDARLSDARTPTAHNHPASEISDSTAAGRSMLTAADAAAQRTLLNVEDGATADQSNAEIAAAYDAEVAIVSQVDAEAGTSTTAERWTPARVKQAIDALAPGGSGLTAADIDTLAELNAILTDATLIDTADSRLSDARTPTAHAHPATEISDSTAAGRSMLTAADAAAQRTLLNVEDGATADQSDVEIETAYNNQVAVVSQADAEAGISTDVKRWTPERVKQAIAALADTDALTAADIDTLAELNAIVTDATLIDTADSRLSDARTPTAHNHPASEISDSTAAGRSMLTAADAAAQRTLLNVEDGATADQSDAEIETAYNAQVAVASQAEAEAGTSTAVKRWTPERVKQAIEKLSLRLLNSETDGATVTFDMADSNLHTVTLGGNRTLALANVTVGQRFVVRLKQDNTGSRLVTWWSGIAWMEGGTVPTLTATANKVDVFGFICTASGVYDGFVLGQNG